MKHIKTFNESIFGKKYKDEEKAKDIYSRMDKLYNIKKDTSSTEGFKFKVDGFDVLVGDNIKNMIVILSVNGDMLDCSPSISQKIYDKAEIAYNSKISDI